MSVIARPVRSLRDRTRAQSRPEAACSTGSGSIRATTASEGFAPVGRVVDGMSAADSLYGEYGEDPRYQLIATLGNKYLARMFPKLDYIITARIDTVP